MTALLRKLKKQPYPNKLYDERKFSHQRKSVNYMAQTKLSQISKDFNMKSKEVAEELKAIGFEKKTAVQSLRLRSLRYS